MSGSVGIWRWPTAIVGPGEMQLALRGNTQTGGRSPFTGTESTLIMPGARWEGSLTYQLHAGARGPTAGQAQVLSAFLSRLRGRQGRFTFSPTIAMPARGVAGAVGSSPVVNGAGQTGEVISTRGWPNSTARLFRPGDFVSWLDPNGRAHLHQVVEDAGSNGSGVCAITVTPSIRRSPADGANIAFGVTTILGTEAGDALVTENGLLLLATAAPFGVFRLSEDAVRQRHRPGFIVEFTINIEEALV